MATIKQKSLKPSTNVPFGQGMLVYNGTGSAIAADKLVSFTTGVNGVQAKIVLAQCGSSRACRFLGRMVRPVQADCTRT